MTIPLAVLDTNVVLDLFVWDNAAADPLRELIRRGELRCLSDPDCLAELSRVLGYPKLGLDAAAQAAIHADYAALCTVLTSQDPAHASPILPRCSDRDDQKFLTLAVRAKANYLLTRDNALLRMSKRMRAFAPQLAIITPSVKLAALAG
jgi:putative PIN family toxin of toxin-antitoxin system